MNVVTVDVRSSNKAHLPMGIAAITHSLLDNMIHIHTAKLGRSTWNTTCGRTIGRPLITNGPLISMLRHFEEHFTVQHRIWRQQRVFERGSGNTW